MPITEGTNKHDTTGGSLQETSLVRDILVTPAARALFMNHETSLPPEPSTFANIFQRRVGLPTLDYESRKLCGLVIKRCF